ncbi:MAG: CCA tRNA nucleotidyltransferase [Lachnospiraceae bacterium]|nr:CCA tRNA nucleotidyltransferase [Lachnospiraceae bacterium]
MQITLPKNVKKIIETLTANGFEAYAVGGCVRDALLSREPKDWDITTSAQPAQVKELFSHTIDTGIQHGTVTVMLDHVGYEVTTYRIDGEYEDCRHPKEVKFTTKLSEDLLRRDFTINAMAYNEQDGVVDLFGGVKDLEAKVIRCVGEAGERFDEDALRILRAYRFAAQLGFSIEEATIKAASERVENLKKVSAERVREELNKLLLSKNPDKLFDAREAGVTKVVLPEFDALVRGGKDAQGVKGVKNGQAMSGMRAVKAVSLVANEALADRAFSAKETQILKWAALLSEYVDTDIFTGGLDNYTEDRGGDKPEDQYKAIDLTSMHKDAATKKHNLVREVMVRLKFDNETRDMVTALCDAHNQKPVIINDVSIRQQIRKLGQDTCSLLYELQKAQAFADGFVSVGEINVSAAKTVERIKKARETYEAIIERGDCVSVKQLAVNGKDLIEAGFPQGEGIGEMLDYLLGKVILDQSLNEKQKLIDIACLNY